MLQEDGRAVVVHMTDFYRTHEDSRFTKKDAHISCDYTDV